MNHLNDLLAEPYDAYPASSSPYSSIPLETSFNFEFSTIVSEANDSVLQEARSLLEQWSSNPTCNVELPAAINSSLYYDHDVKQERREIKNAVAGMVGSAQLTPKRRLEKHMPISRNPAIVMEARQLIAKERREKGHRIVRKHVMIQRPELPPSRNADGVIEQLVKTQNSMKQAMRAQKLSSIAESPQNIQIKSTVEAPIKCSLDNLNAEKEPKPINNASRLGKNEEFCKNQQNLELDAVTKLKILRRFFSSWYSHSSRLKNLETSFIYVSSFRKKSRIMSFWKKRTSKIRIARQEEKMIQSLVNALRHDRQRMLRKALNAWNAFVVEIKSERDKQYRQLAIAKFMKGIQDRYNEGAKSDLEFTPLVDIEPHPPETKNSGLMKMEAVKLAVAEISSLKSVPCKPKKSSYLPKEEKVKSTNDEIPFPEKESNHISKTIQTESKSAKLPQSKDPAKKSEELIASQITKKPRKVTLPSTSKRDQELLQSMLENLSQEMKEREEIRQQVKQKKEAAKLERQAKAAAEVARKEMEEIARQNMEKEIRKKEMEAILEAERLETERKQKLHMLALEKRNIAKSHYVRIRIQIYGWEPWCRYIAQCRKDILVASARNMSNSARSSFKAWKSRLDQRWRSKEKRAEAFKIRKLVLTSFSLWKAVLASKYQLKDLADLFYTGNSIRSFTCKFIKRAASARNLRIENEARQTPRALVLYNRNLSKRSLDRWKLWVKEQKDKRWEEFQKDRMREVARALLSGSRLERLN